MQLHEQVSLAQQRCANAVKVEEEEEEKQPDDAPLSNVTNEPTSVLRNRLFGDREEPTDLSTEHVLQHHRMLQDELSEAMVDMARGLKQRSIALGEALKEDSKVYITERLY